MDFLCSVAKRKPPICDDVDDNTSKYVIIVVAFVDDTMLRRVLKGSYCFACLCV